MTSDEHHQRRDHLSARGRARRRGRWLAATGEHRGGAMQSRQVLAQARRDLAGDGWRIPARSAARAAAGSANGTAISATMRPGRGDMTSTRDARKAASLTEWVTNSPAKRSRSNNPSSSPFSRSRVISSSDAERLVEQKDARAAWSARGQARRACACRPTALAAGGARSRSSRSGRSLERPVGRAPAPRRPPARPAARRCAAPFARAAAWRPGRRSPGCRR